MSEYFVATGERGAWKSEEALLQALEDLNVSFEKGHTYPGSHCSVHVPRFDPTEVDSVTPRSAFFEWSQRHDAYILLCRAEGGRIALDRLIRPLAPSSIQRLNDAALSAYLGPESSQEADLMLAELLVGE